MNNDLQQFFSTTQQRVNRALQQYLADQNSPFSQQDSAVLSSRLADAMRYSALDGGKRIRPALLYAAAEALNAPVAMATDLDRLACALECIHVYSLIHDDLPAMDDDDLRRGKATCHIAFDEATAILAGDALQSEAFYLLSQTETLTPAIQIQLVQALALAAGRLGMVGGQMIDLAAVDQAISLDHLKTMHALKTGALIRVSVELAAIACGATPAQRQALDNYADRIGLAFQVQDDILDVESDTATLGKQQGADNARNKPTYPALMGLDAAKQSTRELLQQAKSALNIFGERSRRLTQVADFIVSRKY